MAKSESFISWEKSQEEECYIIAHLWVAPQDRRQGVGSKLVKEAIEEMREDGEFDTVKLSADSSLEDDENPIELSDLVEFYEWCGFDLEYAGEVVIMSMSI